MEAIVVYMIKGFHGMYNERFVSERKAKETCERINYGERLDSDKRFKVYKVTEIWEEVT